MHIYMYMYTYNSYMHTYIFICFCKYVYTHTHTHIQTLLRAGGMSCSKAPTIESSAGSITSRSMSRAGGYTICNMCSEILKIQADC